MTYEPPFRYSPQEGREARKIIRRYDLTGYPFSERGWLREVHLCRLAIALSLVNFFGLLRKLDQNAP